jgi:hypothetical protein
MTNLGLNLEATADQEGGEFTQRPKTNVGNMLATFEDALRSHVRAATQLISHMAMSADLAASQSFTETDSASRLAEANRLLQEYLKTMSELRSAGRQAEELDPSPPTIETWEKIHSLNLRETITLFKELYPTSDLVQEGDEEPLQAPLE